MSLINTCIGIPLGWLMWLCYKLVKSYGIAILLFTLLSKIILHHHGQGQQNDFAAPVRGGAEELH